MIVALAIALGTDPAAYQHPRYPLSENAGGRAPIPPNPHTATHCEWPFSSERAVGLVNSVPSRVLVMGLMVGEGLTVVRSSPPCADGSRNEAQDYSVEDGDGGHCSDH
jgi:hypothetical protein